MYAFVAASAKPNDIQSVFFRISPVMMAIHLRFRGTFRAFIRALEFPSFHGSINSSFGTNHFRISAISRFVSGQSFRPVFGIASSSQGSNSFRILHPSFFCTIANGFPIFNPPLLLKSFCQFWVSFFPSFFVRPHSFWVAQRIKPTSFYYFEFVGQVVLMLQLLKSVFIGHIPHVFVFLSGRHLAQ